MLPFQDLPQEYKRLMEKITNDSSLNRFYSYFSFQYIRFDGNIPEIEKKIINSLQKYQFITYKTFNITPDSNLIQAVICFEKRCLILEKFDINAINNSFKQINSSIINLNNLKSYDININEEIHNACNMFRPQINANPFIKCTIEPILAYLIRRFYFPSSFFNDPSFFIFNSKIKSQHQNSIDFFSQSNIEIQQGIEKQLKEQKENEKNFQYEIFQIEDFIELRQIYKYQTCFKLVFHMKSLYIFAMKDFNLSIDNKSLDHEINFCENNFNEYIIRFYGYAQKNKKNVGLIYAFMSNGSLSSFLLNHNTPKIQSFIMMIRILSGINYLHSKSLIHRDIKPSNILVDHDYKCYIADLETIRKNPLCSENITLDFATPEYTSPEQNDGEDINGNFISFPTDIYSFGLVIYFLFEKKNMYRNVNFYSNYFFTNEKDYPDIINISKDIQEIFHQCINYDPNKRPKLNNIIEVLVNHKNFFYFIDQMFLEQGLFSIQKEELCQYFYEYIIFISKFADKELFTELIKKFSNLLNSLANGDIGKILYNIGYLYFYDQAIKNYEKSYKYFYLSAKHNYILAYKSLGNYTYKGVGIQKDVSQARKYYEIAAKEHNSDALYALGYLYQKGEGVFIDYDKARYYYEEAAKLKNPKAINDLGLLYYYGEGVVQDFNKAKSLFEEAIKYKYENSFYALGQMYFKGNGVKQNIQEAIKFYELSEKLNYAPAINHLGYMHEIGIGFERDYIKARQYYEKAAKYNNRSALDNLGCIYYRGLGVAKDISRAENLFQKAIDMNFSESYYNLGKLYYENLNAKYCISKAIHYLEIAAERNHPLASMLLGKIFYEGSYVEKDYKTAKKYFMKSSLCKNPFALFYLGKMYHEGLGVKKIILNQTITSY